MFAPNLLVCHNFGYLENFRPHSSIQVDSKGSFSILPPFPNPPFVLLFILLFTYYLIAVSPRGLPAPHSLHNTHTYTHMNPTTTSPPSLKQSQIPPILYKEASSSLHPPHFSITRQYNLSSQRPTETALTAVSVSANPIGPPPSSS